MDIGHENWRSLISDWTVSFGHAILFVCVCGIFVTETACPPGRSKVVNGRALAFNELFVESSSVEFSDGGM